MSRPAYTTADAYRLASLASVDYRTARRALEGEQVKGLAGERLRAALTTFQTTPDTFTPAGNPASLSGISKPQA